MIHDRKLGDIMIRHVATIGPDEKITTAARIMSLKNIGSIIITQDDELVGILTEKDFLKKVIARGLDPNKVLVKDVMTTSLKTAKEDDLIFLG
ncbi:MAG: CBS domain-containing protein, partial [Candidatus Woesearchaeota archaeon]